MLSTAFMFNAISILLLVLFNTKHDLDFEPKDLDMPMVMFDEIIRMFDYGTRYI